MCLQNYLPVIITSNLILASYIKGYHVYKNIWASCIGENVTAEREAVYVKKDEKSQCLPWYKPLTISTPQFKGLPP